MEENIIQEIIDRKFKGLPLLPEEEEALNRWKAEPGNRRLYQEDFHLVRTLVAGARVFSKEEIDRKYVTLEREIDRKRKFRIQWIVTCVAGIALFMFATWMLLGREEAVKESRIQVVATGKQVVLRLDGGEQVEIKEDMSGILKEKPEVRISKSDSRTLLYSRNASNIGVEESKLEYNTLIIPRGKDFHIVLADGTKVWLNAESELTYPLFFGNGFREVRLKGEGYFEVAQDKEHPFVVKTERYDVLVTGTRFNVCNYSGRDETTLAEGSVRLSSGGQSVDIKPGQQSRFSDSRFQVWEVNPAEYIGWVSGCFSYSGVKLERIMEDLARWYDIEVYYLDRGISQLRFSGLFEREKPLVEILNLLERTEKITFDRQGKILFVRKK